MRTPSAIFCPNCPIVTVLLSMLSRRPIYWGRLGIVLLVLGSGVLETPAWGQALFFEGGPPQLRIDRFVPGRSTATDTDASTTLVYERARAPARQLKVVVSTSVRDEQFKLRVEALNPTEGTPRGRVRLRGGMPPTDLLRDIDPCQASESQGGACEERSTLRYHMTARVKDGPGRDEHVVRYTLQAQ
ncbi:MAG: hypothetical protein ABEL04_06560 [Salinibacter sp.]|uniref:hypothetical protein n=1 Tax=Salinibacter sp. TaxID=2065818 RepID=UPI0035D46671